MKTNKLLIGIFLMFVIVFCINFVMAEVSVKVEPDKTINDLDSQTKTNVNNVQNYIKQNMPDLNNNPELGKIVVDVDGKVKLYYNNKLFFDIPKGIRLTPDGKKMVFSGIAQSVSTGGTTKEIPSLVINGVLIGSQQSKTFSAYFEENNGIMELRVTGGMDVSQYNSDGASLSYLIYNLKDGTLKIDSNKKQLKSINGIFGDYGGNIQIGGSSSGDTSFKLNYLGLKNAEINLNDKGEVEYAKLASLKEQTYSFDYNGKKFVFGTNKEGGEVIFDPLHQMISGSNANLAFSKMSVDSKGMFTGSLDSDGKMVSLDLDNKGKFKDDRGNDYSSSKSLKVFLDGKDIKSEENAVSFIPGSASSVALKGLVDVITPSKLHYAGNEKAYSLFDGSSNNNYGKPSFEVKEGIAQIDNGNAKILVRDGEILLNKMGLSDRNGFGSEFVVKAIGGNKKETLANIAYTKDDFSISIKSFVQGKETDTKIVALSKVSETMSLSNLLFNSENVLVEKAYAKSRLDALEKELEIARSDDTDPEAKSKIDALELDILNAKNKINGNVDSSIASIKEYLASQNREDVSKLTAELRLAELIMEKTGNIKQVPDLKLTSSALTTDPDASPVSDSITLKFGQDSNGKVVVSGVYDYNGKLVSLEKIGSEDIENGLTSFEGIPSKYVDLITKLKENSGSLESLQGYLDTEKSRGNSIEQGYDGLSKLASEYEQKVAQYNEAAQNYRSVYDSIVEGKTVLNDGLLVAASFGLADASKKAGYYQEAMNQYKMIADDSEDNSFPDSVRSEAMRQMAIIAAETGSRTDALKYLEQAVSLSSDVNSKVLEKNIQLSYLTQMVSSMGHETTDAYQELLSRIGYQRDISLATSNSQLLSNVNLATGELTEQQLGIFANMYALDNGLTLKEFNSLNQEQRTKALENYWVRKGMNPEKDSGLIGSLVSGSFAVDKNNDMIYLRDPSKNSDLTLTLDTPGKKYMQPLFSLADDMAVYVNPAQAAVLLSPFGTLSIGGKLYGISSIAGGLDTLSLGALSAIRTSSAEVIGGLTTDLLLGGALTYGAYQIPGELYGIPIGEAVAQAAGLLTFDKFVVNTLEKVAGKVGLEAAGAFRSEIGGELKLIPAFRVIGAEADTAAETLAQKGLRMIETEGGEKLFVPTSAEVEGLEYLLKKDLRVGTSEVLRGAQENLDEAVDSLDSVFATSGAGCFLAGTRIMLSDGSYKNIENIQEGDSVKSYDLDKKLVVDSNVTMTFVRKSDSYRIIEYEILG